jgi:DNA repair protein RadD
MNKELRPYQLNALEQLRQSLRSGRRRPVLQLPTGAGKTLLTVAVVEGAMRKGNRVIFCCPAILLIDQTVQMFYDEGLVDVGVIQANHHLTDWSKPVQVASVQTLQRRDVIPEAGVVVVDECHSVFKFQIEWMAKPEWKNVPFIGLSATPFTRGLGKHYDDLIIAATTQELIDLGHLSPFKVFAPAHPDLSGVRTVAGDYHEGDLSGAMDKGGLVADIVDTWIRLGQERPTLCFCVDCAHAKHVQERFDAAGVSAGYIDAFTDMNEREQIKRKYHAGEIKVVCSVGTMIVGVDWKVRCIIWARPTKSEMVYLQGTGRGLRVEDGKDHLLVLDHADNTTRLGFPTDIMHAELDDGSERRKVEAKPRERMPCECTSCGALRAPGRSPCPFCNFKPETAKSKVIEEDGELMEVRPHEKHPTRQPHQYTMFDKMDFYGQLKYYAQEHGYKNGWAANKFKEKHKHWPDDPMVRDAQPVEPTFETYQWIKSRAIAWACSKRRQEQPHV